RASWRARSSGHSRDRSCRTRAAARACARTSQVPPPLPLAPALGPTGRCQDPAGFGTVIQSPAEPAPRMKHTRVADQLAACAFADHEAAVAVEQPAAGVAAEAGEVVDRGGRAAEVAAGLGVVDDREHWRDVVALRQPQLEPLG